jgi:hypothetical protein
MPAPDQAGSDDKTWQLEDFRVRKNAKGYTIWLQKSQQQQQGGRRIEADIFLVTNPCSSKSRASCTPSAAAILPVGCRSATL